MKIETQTLYTNGSYYRRDVRLFHGYLSLARGKIAHKKKEYEENLACLLHPALEMGKKLCLLLPIEACGAGGRQCVENCSTNYLLVSKTIELMI